MRKITASIFFVFIVSGCGSDSDTNPVGTPTTTPNSEEDSVRYLTEIRASTYTNSEVQLHTLLGASTYEFSDATSADYLSSYRDVEQGCVIEQRSPAENDAAREQYQALFPEAAPVSAGEILTITSPSGTWLELAVSDQGSGHYSSGPRDTSSSLLPAGSTIYLPGDSHPQVDDVDLFTPEALTNVRLDNEQGRLSTISESVTPDISISWDPPGSDIGSRIHFSLTDLETDENGDPVSYHYATCNVEDTGSFEIPESIQAEMHDSYRSFQIYRMQQRFEKRGEVLINIQSKNIFEY